MRVRHSIPWRGSRSTVNPGPTPFRGNRALRLIRLMNQSFCARSNRLHRNSLRMSAIRSTLLSANLLHDNRSDKATTGRWVQRSQPTILPTQASHNPHSDEVRRARHENGSAATDAGWIIVCRVRFSGDGDSMLCVLETAITADLLGQSPKMRHRGPRVVSAPSANLNPPLGARQSMPPPLSAVQEKLPTVMR